MEKRILIAFATLLEAQPTLTALQAVQNKNHTHLYTFEDGIILITGMGGLNACSAISTYAAECDLIWNIGIAGALHKDISIDTIYSITTVDKHLSFPEELDEYSQKFAVNIHPSISVAKQGKRLLTSDFPVHHNTLRDKLQQHWDIIDMEGYGVCCAAQRYHKPCIMHKLISDFAAPNGQHLIKSRITLYSQQLAEYVMQNRKDFHCP